MQDTSPGGDVERQQTAGGNGNVQTPSWEGRLRKRLSYTVSQLMSTEGFNNINSLRLTVSWGCKSNGASFHLHLHGCFFWALQVLETRRGVLEQLLCLLHGFLFLPGRLWLPQKFSVGAAYCTAVAFCAREIKRPLSSNSLALLRQH